MRARALAWVFIGVLTSGVAVAQPAPNPEGAKLFEEGRALAERGKFEEACAKFEQSLALDPGIGTQVNYALCHEALKHFAQAWRLFDSAADAEKITNPKRAKFSRDRADALLKKVGVIVIKIAQPDLPMLTVSIGGRSVKPAAVVTELVDPGDVAISVTAQNKQPFKGVQKITAGKTLVIEVPPFKEVEINVPVAPVPVVTTSAPDPSDAAELGPRRRSRVLLAYGVGGAGAVALVAGVLIGVKAKGDYNAQFDNMRCMEVAAGSECNDEGFAAQNDAISLANIGTGVGIAGIALVGAGAVLFFTAPRDVVVAPTATASSGGISVVGRF